MCFKQFKSILKKKNKPSIYDYNLTDKEYYGKSKKSYEKDKYQDHLIDQYRILTDKADRISDKRAVTNGFFLTLNTIIGTASIVLIDIISNSLFIIPLSVIGILFSLLWFGMIRNYKKLNTAKFNVINKIEEKLPIKGFYAEWEILKKKMKYKGISEFEKWIPWFIILMYCVLIGFSICSFV